MSAVKDYLISECERLEAEGFGGFDELMGRMLDTVPTGYTCKRCGAPSPVGVGYVDNTTTAHRDAGAVTVCLCGYSRAPYVHTGLECGAL